MTDGHTDIVARAFADGAADAGETLSINAGERDFVAFLETPDYMRLLVLRRYRIALEIHSGDPAPSTQSTGSRPNPIRTISVLGASLPHHQRETSMARGNVPITETLSRLRKRRLDRLRQIMRNEEVTFSCVS